MFQFKRNHYIMYFRDRLKKAANMMLPIYLKENSIQHTIQHVFKVLSAMQLYFGMNFLTSGRKYPQWKHSFTRRNSFIRTADRIDNQQGVGRDLKLVKTQQEQKDKENICLDFMELLVVTCFRRNNENRYKQLGTFPVQTKTSSCFCL